MVPQTTVTHLPSDILIIYNQLVIPISIINGLTAQPLHVIKWIAQEDGSLDLISRYGFV